ncbi:MAG: DUF4197 domain-containing protein [Bacteroidales bacterium]|nr:DUF4197 domain-containing protein [Bacteroidales bacterium]
MKFHGFIIVLSLGFFISPAGPRSCDDVLDTAIAVAMGTDSGPKALSNTEIINGLKTALNVGTDSSVSTTSAINGFYKDEAIKILLPPEAKILYDNKDKALLKTLKLDQKIEEAIMALNRAAEDAAKEAGPIFKDAILNMSISDGMSILKGKNPLISQSNAEFDSSAATSYLQSATRDKLRDAFAPKVNTSLDKVLVGNYSPNQIWNSLSTNYNTVADKSFGMVEPMNNTNLGAYVTEKALDGLFLKVAEEEIKIRRDPWAWAKTSVGNILSRVFGG